MLNLVTLARCVCVGLYSLILILSLAIIFPCASSQEFSLGQNYPNPFNPTTTIEFTVPEDGHVLLRVYDISGREVATLVDEERKAGVYQQVVFDAASLASGLYFARLQAAGKQLDRKMILRSSGGQVLVK
ncbi:MAG: T9SS type A sorting domain-containing protein [Ignavibacteriales bacterium]|nr:T9SS type A sorting domain-containing protein [Ignavibacteriales bacterium]